MAVNKSKYIKYPRTYHLPWSEGSSSDDKILAETSCFDGKQIVITEKMDGENTTMYSDYLHARSIDLDNHPSRNWIKALHSGIAHAIPKNWRLCGENLYAKHSIAYSELDSYFLLFSIWDQNNYCLDWVTTLEWAKLLNLSLPKILYSGLWNEKLIRSLNIDICSTEGYVVRTAEKFHYDDFKTHCAKWVRKFHVQTDKHWKNQKLIPNKLLNKDS